MGKIVGIDLGTTNSVVATVDLGGVRILQNKEAEQQTRSVVGYNKGEFLVGTPALRRWPLAPKDTIISIKRLMGRAYSDPEVEKIKAWAQYQIVEPSVGTKDSVCVKLGGKEYFPVEISALVLSKLKADAEFVLGDKVTHAVITVPAYFNEKQKYATREAGLKAGLTVMKILDEPTAAAIAFGMDVKQKDARTVLVYDLGGGTFDISILMMAAGAFAPLNLEGDMWLGGDNFDQVIADFVVDKVKNENGVDATRNLRFMATLKLEAQKAKETLSSALKAEIIIPALLQDGDGNYVDVEVELTRSQFEQMIQPFVDRTIMLVKKAVENANFNLEEIDHVLMAGNSTCVPKVQQAMEELFGKDKILRKVHPKYSVALGAAMTAAIYGYVLCPKCEHNNDLDAVKCAHCGTALAGLERKICPSCGRESEKTAEKCAWCASPFVQIDGVKGGIAPFNYGVQTAGDRFNAFINKGDRYKTPDDKIKVQTFYTRFPSQRMISIPVYGGDILEAASRNQKMGEAFAILPGNLPGETPVRVKLWLTNDGYFDLSAHLDDGTDLKPWILRGGEDQLAIEVLISGDEERGNKEPLLSSKEREKADQLRNEVLNLLQDKKFDEARGKANEYKEHVEKAGQAKDILRTQVEGLIGYVDYIVNEYGWLLGGAAYQINNLKGSLIDAVAKNDQGRMESAAKDLMSALEGQMQTTDPSGQPVPTLLATFLALHGAIVAMIQPSDPARAQNLREELASIEKAFKANQPDAVPRINAFAEKLAKVIAEIKPPEEGIKCPQCGFANRQTGRYCANCKADLWILEGQRMGTRSRG
jgi:molecular chaperone DnaK (HSP70)